MKYAGKSSNWWRHMLGGVENIFLCFAQLWDSFCVSTSGWPDLITDELHAVMASVPSRSPSTLSLKLSMHQGAESKSAHCE